MQGQAQLTQPASLARRLAVAVYDGMLVIAIWMSITVVATPVLAYLSVTSSRPIQILAIAGSWIYFAYSWSRGGQSLGMRAWRVHIRRHDADALPTLTLSSSRFFMMLLLCIAPVTLGAIAFVPAMEASSSQMRWLLLIPVLCMGVAQVGSRRALLDYFSRTEMITLQQRPAASAD